MALSKAVEGYVPGIDALRAVAVLGVLLFHMRASWLPGGFAGVDVFFVISGYVVSASLARRQHDRIGAMLLGFYARRMLRILPALLVCVLVTGVATTMLIPASWLSETTAYTGLASVFGLGNFALVWFSDGYFSPRAEFNPFTHTWSLAVEEQFYLVFPLLFHAWIRGRARTGHLAFAGRMLLPVALALSLLLCIYQTGSQPDLAYYMLPGRFWALAAGAMLFRLHQSGRALPAGPRQADLWAIGGATLIGAAFVLADARRFPYPWALPVVLGTILAIGASVGSALQRGWTHALLGSRLVAYLGKISYSLYLWHWPVLVLLRWTVGLDDPGVLAIAAVLTFGLAMLSYHGVEQGRWWRRGLAGAGPGRTVAGAAAGLLLCAACLGAVLQSRQWISLSVTRDGRTWYPHAPKARAAPGQVPTDPAVAKLFVWGDSHAGAYSSLLQELKERTGAQVFSFARGGCPVAAVQEPTRETCKPWIEDTAARIKRLAMPGDVVLLASLRVDRLSDQWATFAPVASAPMRADGSPSAEQLQSLHEADALVTALEQAGLQVVIDAPKPVFRAPPFRCADWFNARNPICAHGFAVDRGFLQAHRRPTMEALAALQKAHPRLVVWDPFPVLCPGAACSAFDGDRPLFFDGDHLSGHGNRVLYPSFSAMLTALA